jgi:galactonate dehydratase
VDCQFNASYRRGKLPEIQAVEVPRSLSNSNDATTSTAVIHSPANAENRNSSDYVPDTYHDDVQEAIEEEETSIIPQVHVGSQGFTRWTSGQNGISQTNGSELEPHYIGPSSGLSFLLRAQMRLQNTVKSSKDASIFTFGDAPLPEVDFAFLDLPPLEEARSLVATYFDFAFPTHRFLHRPTTEQWLSEFYQNKKRLNLAPGTRERYATVLMVLSQAKLYTSSKTDGGPDVEGR